MTNTWYWLSFAVPCLPVDNDCHDHRDFFLTITPAREKAGPDEPYEWNYRHDAFRFRNSGAKMETDIYFPRLKIGFEFQGAQHFGPVDYFGGQEQYEITSRRDEEKRVTLAQGGILVIEVPAPQWKGDMAYILDLLELHGVRPPESCVDAILNQ